MIKVSYSLIQMEAEERKMNKKPEKSAKKRYENKKKRKKKNKKKERCGLNEIEKGPVVQANECN